MARIIRPKRPVMLDEDLDPKELGSETEAEKQMKHMLQKQLKTNISLQDQFQEHRKFVSPSTQCALKVSGSCSLKELQAFQQLQEKQEYLQRCGLKTEEIELYTAFKSGMNTTHKINPAVKEESLKLIESKVLAHDEELKKSQTFVNVKKLTRHEMDIEKSLYSGCSNKLQLSSLVVNNVGINGPKLDDAYKYLQSLSEKIDFENKVHKKLSKKFKKDIYECESQYDLTFDSDIHHAIVPLSASEIDENKLKLEDILQMPKFSNYEPGIPSLTLYIKNLHTKVSVQELRSLFGSFEEDNKSLIEYKICSGRMKGQAFVKFSNIDIAKKALNHVNGYLLQGKPIIIEFGRKCLSNA